MLARPHKTHAERWEDIRCTDAQDITCIEVVGRSLEIKGQFLRPYQIDIHKTMKVMDKFKYASYSKNSIVNSYNAHTHLYLESEKFHCFFSYDSPLNRDFQYCAKIVSALLRATRMIRKHNLEFLTNQSNKDEYFTDSKPYNPPRSSNAYWYAIWPRKRILPTRKTIFNSSADISAQKLLGHLTLPNLLRKESCASRILPRR